MRIMVFLGLASLPLSNPQQLTQFYSSSSGSWLQSVGERSCPTARFAGRFGHTTGLKLPLPLDAACRMLLESTVGSSAPRSFELEQNKVGYVDQRT